MRSAETWELEDEPWEASLASVYREVLQDAPSPVLERCIERLEAEALEGDFDIVEEIPLERRELLRRQALAAGVDAALVAGLALFARSIAGNDGAVWLFVGLAAFFYLTLGVFLGGSTIGDRVARIRRVPAEGERLGLALCALRSLLAMLGVLSVVGLFWSLVDPSGRSLHDRILGTQASPSDQP